MSLADQEAIVKNKPICYGSGQVYCPKRASLPVISLWMPNGYFFKIITVIMLIVLTFFTKAVIAFKNRYIKVIFAREKDEIWIKVTICQEFF